MTPRIVDKTEKKAAILEAAMKQFARKGIAATKMTDIAEEAGIGKGTIYEYFPTKEAIFNEAFNVFYTSMDRELMQIVHSDLPVSAKLEALMEKSLSMLIRDDPDFATIMMDFWAEGIRNKDDNSGMTKLDELYKNYRKLLADLIQEGIDNGEFRPLSPVSTASIIMGALDGIYLQWFLDKSAIDYVDLIETMQAFFRNGLHNYSPEGNDET